MAGVVQEPLYEEFNKYPEFTEYYGSKTQETFYKQRILIGKTSFYNFTIPSTLTGINDGTCKTYCKVCYNTICVKCLENYILKENPNSCVPINSIIEGFYYDDNSKTYKKCCESCKTCSKGPTYYNERLDIEDSNCDSCIINFYFVINTKNCVHKDNPPISYYFDENQGLFLHCYENCMTCNKYKTNSTYFNCLSCDDNRVFYEKSANCLNCSYLDKYINYYQYNCYDNIPDGYYLLNEEKKIINKCYITCKHCNTQGNSDDHKCTECADAYPYNYNNGQKCLDDCSKEKLYFEPENNKCYKDCINNNLNDKTYNYKNKCISRDEVPKNYILDEKNNYVSKCNPTTEYEFNNECYTTCPDGTHLDENKCICNKLYYLKGEEYVCIQSKVCPNEYPYLKIGSSECSNCPVVYKGECLLECPEGTCLTQINQNLATCVDKLGDTKILAGLCFDDFIIILDQIGNLDTSNKVMNEYPSISLNIYNDKIDLVEVINNNENNNLTFIDINKCAEKIKSYYKLNSIQLLCVISVDMLTKWSNKSTNDFDFEIYLENGTQIEDLSPCYDEPITVSVPITNLDLVNFEYAEIFYEQGYDIYNLSSSFYNDRCTAASLNGNDITLEDRVSDIYPGKVSFCPKGCELTSTDIEKKRFICSCNVSFTTEEYYSNDNNEESDDEKKEIFLLI